MLAVDKKDKIVYILVLVFVVIKLIVGLLPHVPGWDESVYIGMGKYLYSFGSSGLWESLRPVGLPLLLGAIWKIGFPLAYAAEFLMTMFAAGSILVTYFISKKLFSETVGLMSSVLLIGTGLFFSQSSLFMTELPSSFFALLTLYYLINRKLAWASLFAVIAAMFKFPHLLLILIIGLFLVPSFLIT